MADRANSSELIIAARVLEQAWFSSRARWPYNALLEHMLACRLGK